MHKRSSFWKYLDSQRINESRKLLKSAEMCFSPTSPSFRAKLSYKNSFLDISGIFGLLTNTLTADDEYSGHNTENYPLTIQMQLSKKSKIFCCNYIVFMRSKIEGT